MTKCLIIAEAGVNHNGSLKLAHQLVLSAKASGADIVKFQTFNAEKLVTESAPRARYQEQNTGEKGSQYELLKSLELDEQAFVELARHCEAIGIEFLSTPFDLDSAHMLAKIGMKRVKVSSGDLTNKPFLRGLARFNLPMILSSGLATLGDIEAAISVIEGEGLATEDISILHCTTEYPAPFSEVNLRAMNTIARAFPDCTPGYSDHSEGIEIPVAAVALGAMVIEKHLTLDHSLPGPDHKASLEPADFLKMTSCIRNVEQALGTGRKRPTPSETPNIAIARKSIVAAKPIRSGETFDETNIAARRPGSGISPMFWDEVVGLSADRDYEAGDLLRIPGLTNKS